MRTFLIAILSVALLASIASAEMLVTANPIGQGRWAVLGAGLQDQNASNMSGWTMTSIGGYVGYGILNQLDAYLQAGMGNMGGLPAGWSGSTTVYGLSLKYALLEEGDASPVSVAIGGGAKALQMKSKATVDSTSNNTIVSLGVGVSKAIAPLIPYGGIMYRSYSGDSEGTQLDATLGSAIAWSEQGAVFVEYTLQSITPKGGSNYSSGQIGAGVGYVI